jgi:hypothetical protein
MPSEGLDALRGAVDDLVGRCLRRELQARDLLLSAAEVSSATRDAASLGTALFRELAAVTYDRGEMVAGRTSIEFGEGGTQPRVMLSLAFGATTARLLGAPPQLDLLCATFNLGIGLVDGLCDNDRSMGLELLDVLRAADLSGGCRQRRPRGWLTVELPRHLAANHAVAFTVRVIEVFFDLLHVGFPGGRCTAVRDRAGALVTDALEAESLSIVRPHHAATPKELIDASRRTSILPFVIMEHLARGGGARAAPSLAGSLGKAVWLIDDLVDLTRDVRADALNAVVVAATASEAPDVTPDPRRVLERVLMSGILAPVAAQAAEYLDHGLRAAEPTDPYHGVLFVSFVQAYAGIVPAATTTDSSSSS